MLQDISNQKRRTLLLSLRKAQNFVFNSLLYEFEDVVSQVDLVDNVFVPPYDNSLKKILNKVTKNVTRHSNWGQMVPMYTNPVVLEQEYDLFFVILDFPHCAPLIQYVKNWRQKCKKAVCFLTEIWDQEVEDWQYALKLLENFDHVFLSVNHSVEDVAGIIQRPCTYLPPSVDTLRFYPRGAYSERSIDVCSLGRRSPITHEALVKIPKTKPFFYYFDSASKTSEQRISNPGAHRTLLANLLNNSRYYITNKAKINHTRQTKGHQEIGYRFFEGAASGAVMIGSPPETPAFDKYFDWQNVVLPVPYDVPNIGEILAELDSQPELLAKISRDNVINSLLKHDVVYRWQEILASVGLEPTSGMKSRQAHLRQLAQKLEEPVILQAS